MNEKLCDDILKDFLALKGTNTMSFEQMMSYGASNLLLGTVSRLIDDGMIKQDREVNNYTILPKGLSFATYKTYVGEKEKEDLAFEKDRTQLELLKSQKETTNWQNKWGKRLTVFSFITAFTSLISTILIAFFLKTPAVNNVYPNVNVLIDSNVISKKIPPQKHTPTKTKENTNYKHK